MAVYEQDIWIPCVKRGARRGSGGISIEPSEVSFFRCMLPCLLDVDASEVYNPAIDGLNGGQNRVRRSILPRSTTWIYFYGAPPANIGHVAQLRFAVLLRSGCGGCVPVLTFASHAHACFYRVMLSTHYVEFQISGSLDIGIIRPNARSRSSQICQRPLPFLWQ